MKLLIILILSIIILIQCVNSHNTIKSKRSISYIDTVKNKTLSFATYVKNKARSLWPFETVATVEDQATKISQKLKGYIEQAQRKTTAIFDSIAPDIDSSECKTDDPAIHMNAQQLITLHGYFSESHVILTQDGYMLTVHRIPFSRKSVKKEVSRKAVLVHHGLLGSSADWVLAGPRNSLAFMLSDAGYDVWLANVRGNEYSRAHISTSFDTYTFWNFSFHEVAQYDLPAVIDYIIQTKDVANISYIGFSMGTTVLFALLSTKTEYNQKLDFAIALAPIAYMSEVKTPFKTLSKAGNSIQRFLKLVGANEFLPRNAVLRYLANHACSFSDFQEALCEVSMFLLCGHDNEHFDIAMMPIILGHVPAGASTKTLAHYAQEINAGGRFQQFDYGLEENLKRYGIKKPPEYKVHNITLPISMISGQNDWLSNITDAKRLFSALKSSVEHYIIEDTTFNHLDFVFAKDASELVYDKVLNMLRDHL